MRSIMAKYNYAFGYISGILIDCTILSIIMIPIVLVQIATGNMSFQDAMGNSLIPGIIFIVLGVFAFVRALKKCPLGKKNPGILLIWMFLAGIVAYFIAAWWVIKFGAKLFFHINLGSSSTGYKYAQRYSTASSGYGQEWLLYNACGNYAVLNDGHGNLINARPNNPDSSDGLLVDDSGNIYYPR